MIFNFFQLAIGDLTGSTGSHRFKDILNAEFLIAQLSWKDGPAIENDGRNIQSQGGHGGTGNGFIASDEANQTVKHIAAGGELNGIGDEIARDQ